MKGPDAVRWLIVLLALAAGTTCNRADEAAVTMHPVVNVWFGGGGPGLAGWQFKTHLDLKVSSLGVHDAASIYDGGFVGDGFRDPLLIGLWDVSTRNLLASVAIPAGQVAPMIDTFRYLPVPSVLLAAENDYVIAAIFGDDIMVGPLALPDPNLKFGPGIEHIGDWFTNNATTLDFPTYFVPEQASTFGPSFRYTVVTPVPEASTFVGGIAGVVFVTFAWRRRIGQRR